MRGIIVGCLLAFTAPTHADDGVRAAAEPAPESSRHLVYLELLGKGGLYGVGYEYAIADWLGVGGAASFSELRDQQVITASPYVHVTALAGRRHALFGEVGAIFAHAHVASPVMGWDGASDSGGGGFAALGWQYQRGHVVVRASGGVVAGEGGLAPMLGFAIGARP